MGGKERIITMRKKYYSGFQVHDVLNEVLEDGYEIMEILNRFASLEQDDVIEVIRCKECKYWEQAEYNTRKHYCTWDKCEKPAKHYCGWAERKEE